MSNDVKGRKVSAREMTAEIDAATDGGDVLGLHPDRIVTGVEIKDATGASAGNEGTLRGVEGRFVPQEGITQEQMRQMGAQWLQQERRREEQMWRRQEQSEIEAGMDEQELSQPEEFVGEASRLQEAERMAADRQEYALEHGEGLKFESKIVAKNQEERGRIVAQKVGKFLAQKNPRIDDILTMYREERDATLRAFDPPRAIGDRN